MEKYFEFVVVFVIGFILLMFISTLNGTILWMIYPHIHAFFPTAAEKGVIAKDLGWWDSVCVVWIFTILIKPSKMTSKKDN